MKSIAICLMALGATAALGAPLSMEDAQRRAVDRSRQLAAAESGIAASREMAIAAGQLPDPVLRAGIDNLPVEGGDKYSLTRDFMTMRRIGLMQELTRSGKRDLRRQRFEREADKGLAEKDAALATIQKDTALAWLDRFYLEAMQRAVADFIGASDTEVQSADAAYRAGRGPQSDVFATRAALALARDRESEIGRRLRAARIDLARWTGEPRDEPLAQPPEMERVPLASDSLEVHLAAHPEVLALDRQSEVADLDARLADAAKDPDWTVEATFQQRGPAYSNMVSIGISIPLPWDKANRQDREAAAKRATAEEARARRDEMLRAHLAEVAGMLDEWRTGRERQSRFRAEILPLSAERTHAALAGYAGGKGSLADVLSARRNESDMALQSLQLDLDVARLWARLRFLLPDAGLATTTHHRSQAQ